MKFIDQTFRIYATFLDPAEFSILIIHLLINFLSFEKNERSFIGGPIIYEQKLVGIVGQPSGQFYTGVSQIVTGKVFIHISQFS